MSKTAVALSSPTGRSPKALAQLTVEPRCLRFSEIVDSASNVLKITNNSMTRMAWRVLSNAPKAYLVNPSKGYIAARESAKVEVTLMDKSKYINRHQFVVQMKVAKDEDIDREDVWEKKDGRQLYNIRVITAMDRDPARAASSASGSAASSPSSASTAISPAPTSHGEFGEMITQLEEQAKKAMDEKAERTRELTQLVNDVKLLEMSLDKSTNRLYAASLRCEDVEGQLEMVKKKRDGVRKEMREMQSL